jgi:hypothetical protein
MSEHLEEIRRVVTELDAHLAEVEAKMAVLKALLAEDDGEGSGETHQLIPPAGNH